MPTTCPRCSRVNPANAVFCYSDGAALGTVGQNRAVIDPARQRFPRPFVFPSGHPCHSFDELVLACFNEWKSAGELLREGTFAAFLAGLGRADLARAAREAAQKPDLDHALNGLINRLPSSVLQPPRLQTGPDTFNLGEARPGKDILLVLQLQNAGLGLLTGTADCSGTPWLFLGQPGAASKKKVFQFLHDGSLPLFIQGKALQANRKPLEGQVVFDTNGGQVIVPVRLIVPVVPFPQGVFAGCTTPRQIAEKALAHQKEAGELFASGAVAAWYAMNGWSYPVKEAAAVGVAAVQQFFEALGLSKPVKVAIDRKDLHLEAAPGETASDVITLTTDEKRPIWAHVECSAPWVDVREVALDKKVATVRLGASRVPDQPGEQLQARATITTNGRVQHVVTLRLKVRGRRRDEPVAEVIPMLGLPPVGVPAAPVAMVVSMPLPSSPPPPPPIVEPRERPARRRVAADREPSRSAGGMGQVLAAAIPVLLTLLGLSVTLGRDLGTWWAGKPHEPVAGMETFEGREQVLHLAFHDRNENVTLAVGGSVKPGEVPGRDARAAIWEPSMRFGLSMEPGAGQNRRRLTFDPIGLTNNTVVRLNGREAIFGERPFRDAQTEEPLGRREDWPGQWQEIQARLDRPLKEGRKSVWLYSSERVTVTQTVGLMLGEQTGRIDTCLVHYRIDNRDTKPHRVGLRFLLDTYIGGNDGVPFLIPGKTQLCATTADFRGREVPDFIQACEREDLRNPGTIAQIQLRMAGLPAPSRVTLGSWPNPELPVPNARQEKTLWEVPVLPMKTLNPHDSAVTIYWDEEEIAPGGSREMAFAYGLGTVSADDTQGQLALTVGGSFVPGGEFTLTAYVRSPRRGQRLTLQLPEGLTRVAGEENEPVPPPPADGTSQISPVTWRIRAGAVGTYALKVVSSTGVSQTQNVRIKVRGIFGN